MNTRSKMLPPRIYLPDRQAYPSQIGLPQVGRLLFRMPDVKSRRVGVFCYSFPALFLKLQFPLKEIPKEYKCFSEKHVKVWDSDIFLRLRY